MIECPCGKRDCNIKVGVVYDERPELWMYGPDGNHFQMYLDPNTIVELLQVLKKALVFYIKGG